jgi:hypothetical protein
MYKFSIKRQKLCYIYEQNHIELRKNGKRMDLFNIKTQILQLGTQFKVYHQSNPYEYRELTKSLLLGSFLFC